ncbi:MAG: hypothetical protein JW855_01930 [Gammaproteobacteria bacterium]|nr:hypothetical protein [Gammaproteobacteria bacterium]
MHQYLSSIDEDNENLEKFIQQSLMYHEHFGRNLDWLYKVLVEKPETISKRSREYILQYLPLVADVFRKNPENVRTHRLVAEFCGFAVKKENIEKLNYLGKDVERMESIETILNFKEVHEESYKDLRGKLRDFHKEEWAGDSKFKKALWHILDFFGKWKGKIELNMKESVKSKDNKEATTSYILSQIKEKAACAKKVTSAEKEAEKRRDKLAKEMAQTLIKFKKAGGEIEEGQKKQFGKAIGKFFPKAPEEKSSSKPSREKRRLQQAASELGIA